MTDVGGVNSSRRHAPGSRAAFTLFELVSVLVILGLLAASSIPALSTLRDLKVESVRTEVASALVFARETASATGTPTGVRIDLDSQEMSYVQIAQTSASPTLMTDSSGEAREPVAVGRHGGATVDGVSGSGPGSGGLIIWFGHAGVPEHRSAGGSYIQDAPSDITVSFSAGDPIVVHAHTGVVE